MAEQPRLWEENQAAWDAWDMLNKLRRPDDPLKFSEVKAYAAANDLPVMPLAWKLAAVELTWLNVQAEKIASAKQAQELAASNHG